MTAPTTIQRILDVIRRQNWLQESTATAETKIDDLHLDEIDRVILAMELEDEFRVTVAEDDEDGWETIADIAATIEALLATAQPDAPLAQAGAA